MDSGGSVRTTKHGRAAVIHYAEDGGSYDFDAKLGMVTVARRVLFALATACLACARYEPAPGYETLARTPAPPECFERPATIAVAPAPDGGASGTPGVGGIVQDEHARPVIGAAVDLRGDSVFLARTDSSGRFAFTGVPLGHYRLRVRAVGYNILEQEITRGDTATQAYLIVTPVRIFDGPCSAVVVVKKPWWKWW